MNKLKKYYILASFLVLSLNPACSQGTILLDETFSYPDGPLPSGWWYEGSPSFIKDNRLYVDSDTTGTRVSTVWLDREFSGDLSIEFDVQVVSSHDTSNNINFFLYYSSLDGKPLQETREERMDGRYPRYHKLNGYIFTHLANGNEDTARFRFRYNPGFNLLEEVYTYECRKNTTYHVKIIKKGNHFQYWTDGKLILEKTVDETALIEKGIIGFRTFHTSLWWDNLKITQN